MISNEIGVQRKRLQSGNQKQLINYSQSVLEKYQKKSNLNSQKQVVVQDPTMGDSKSF